MRWFKITIPLSEISIHRELNEKFLEIYKKNNTPENLKLYQNDPDSQVEYYISIDNPDLWMITNLRIKYTALEVKQPDTSKMFLLIGEIKQYRKPLPTIR